ncbi:LysR family transcriptional regulator [Bosea sp. TAF32]|uniref:LysR family transcriptional regulator n=1 Tax=Bosea sp. TAF32 TaxID=3237482 RepID=UPI003F9138EB
MSWDDVQAFLAVFREGSLTGGARALALAQPTVRHRIEALERQVGTALFTRTPTGLTPTETALTLFGHAEAMSYAAEALLRTASGSAREIAGVVRVSASEVIAIEVLPPIVARLRVAYPELVIALSPSNRNEDVLRREADIAVRMAPPAQDGLVARRIGAIAIGLHAHRDYLDRTGWPRDLADVIATGLIGLEHDDAILKALRAAGSPLAMARTVFRSDNHLAHLAAIRAGVGYGLCQVSLAARDGALVRLFPDDANFDLETWIVTHEDLRSIPRISAVMEAIRDGLRHYIRGGELAACVSSRPTCP